MNVLERCTTDYGVAAIAYGEHSADQMLAKLNSGDGVPFLSLAGGHVGILRAMEVRCGPLCIEDRFTLAAVKNVDGKPIMFWWVLDGTDKRYGDHRPNYARDHNRGAQGQ